MSTVRELLKAKGSELWSIAPDATVYAALELMAEKDVGALPVVEGGELVGIFSERDYARGIVLKGKSSRDTPVADLMSRKVLYVSPDETVDGCMQRMTKRRVRHLPVLDEGELVGIVTIGDVVHRIISEQGETIDQLETYITDTR